MGNQLTLRFFDLSNLRIPLVNVATSNSTFSQGIPGFWVFANNSAYDTTLDNCMVTGTMPR